MTKDLDKAPITFGNREQLIASGITIHGWEDVTWGLADSGIHLSNIFKTIDKLRGHARDEKAPPGIWQGAIDDLYNEQTGTIYKINLAMPSILSDLPVSYAFHYSGITFPLESTPPQKSEAPTDPANRDYPDRLIVSTEVLRDITRLRERLSVRTLASLALSIMFCDPSAQPPDIRKID